MAELPKIKNVKHTFQKKNIKSAGLPCNWQNFVIWF